jgi:hypothetical protein
VNGPDRGEIVDPGASYAFAITEKGIKAMKRRILANMVSLAALLALFAAASCTEKSLQTADKVVKDVNIAGTVTRTIVESPAGGMIPDPFRGILEMLGFFGMAAYGIWQRIRASGILSKSQDKSTALAAVVDAIDQLAPAQAQPVKDQVAQVMSDREITSTANAVVDEHRSKLSA